MILHEYIRAKYLTCALRQVVLDDDDVDDDDDERQLKSQLWLQEPLFSVGKS